MTSSREQRNQFWQDHINAAAQFKGSAAEYCRQNGLNRTQFYWHKKNFSKKTDPRGFVALTLRPEVPQMTSLPDPESEGRLAQVLTPR